MTGSDYEHPSQVALARERRKRFQGGATMSRDGNIEIIICDDTVEEDPESFEVYITDEFLQNAFIFPYRVATVIIVDNDGRKWYMVQQSILALFHDLHVTCV